ncbi:xylulokinase [Cohnella herbarum]|uniref:Xylulokinase n=1 Tax=Cohnella herbarum TaxID=2728023 RepID=A0A7Z2VQ58_9BACL|nr:FGGY family carbohydrate kinase [Cohnella herbarum]QJD87148.1 hypothetical protein HH215_30880 [Cohnella herbarum]
MSIFLGVDIGTSGIRAVAFTERGETLEEGRTELNTAYPGTGYVEQNPEDWRRALFASLQTLTAKLGGRANEVQGIGLTGQCPTFTLQYPDGKMWHTALLYQDNRAITQSERLIEKFGRAELHRRTGEAPSPFYIVPKLMWLQEHRPDCLVDGAVVVQPRDAVGWFLTGTMATDPTHAACTLAYDIETGDWMRDWLERLGLDRLSWPRIIPSNGMLGKLSAEASKLSGLPEGIPVAMGAADSLCAVYAIQKDEPVVLYDVSGTSTCLHLAVDRPVESYAVNTYPYLEQGKWLAEVGLNTTGIALSWLAKLFGKTLAELMNEADKIEPGANGLLFLPHLGGGERDVPTRPGGFIGLHLGHTQGDMARAVLEGVALALRQRIELLERSGSAVREVVVCGGGARSGLWNQIKADVFGLPVSAVDPPDTTVLGAAMTAMRMLNLEPKAASSDLISYFPDLRNKERYEGIYMRFDRIEEQLK